MNIVKRECDRGSCESRVPVEGYVRQACDAGSERACITGLYRDRGWSALHPLYSGCRSEPDIDHESDQVP